ncbi:MAG: 3-deoxy-7-phosphoheptulonate synthase [Bacillota bacterium]
MIIVMADNATEEDIQGVVKRLEGAGMKAHLSQGVERTIIGLIGDKRRLVGIAIEALPGVEEVIPILQPYKMASRSFRAERTVVRVGDLEIGGERIHVMAGPCAVESREQLLATAEKVAGSGATILRGGAFKPRTSPYAFQGMGEEGLKILAEARERFGLKIVTEVMDIRTLPLVAEYADIIQVGARNMQNFDLLKEIGTVNKPILLKRGLSATIEEWLMAAEYVLAGGNLDVILCERGIRSFETYTRNTLDLSAVPIVKYLSHLPVIVDPSHGIGRWKFVAPMSRAAIAAGADGLIVEVHTNPVEALCDGAQSLTPENFDVMMKDLRQIAKAMGKKI